MSIEPKDLKTHPWKSIWAGDWSLFDVSDWGEYYMTGLVKEGRPFLTKAVFLYKNGKVSAWVDEDEVKDFSQRLNREMGDDMTKADALAKDAYVQTDASLDFMAANLGKPVNSETYKSYYQSIRNYYVPHISIKYFLESVSVEKIDNYLKAFQKARVYAEPVFTKTVEFERTVTDQISKSSGYDANILFCLTRDELLDYLRGGKLPDKKELEKRWAGCALVFYKGGKQIFTGDAVSEIEQMLMPKQEGNLIKGSSAFKGVVQGKVRIVIDPQTQKVFNKGEILVAKMTRPEYLPFMEKAAGIVTDAGGVLSHAAISAREMEKVCVIGTKVATQVLKDGDLIEVDGDNGIVKRLESHA